jgi:hypothetical protein
MKHLVLSAIAAVTLLIAATTMLWSRLSDLEPKFTCQVCGHKGADIRPLFEPERLGTGG